MEMNPLETGFNVFSQLAFTDEVDSLVVWDGTILMELSEEIIEFYLSISVVDKFMPEVALREASILRFEIVDDLREVPREGEQVGMLLLRELHINTDSLPGLLKLQFLVFWLLLDFNLRERPLRLVVKFVRLLGDERKGSFTSGGETEKGLVTESFVKRLHILFLSLIL